VVSDLAGLKRRFGQRLIFCGAINGRQLAQATSEQVEREIERVTGALASGGGDVLASVHTILNDVPAENILALARAARVPPT